MKSSVWLCVFVFMMTALLPPWMFKENATQPFAEENSNQQIAVKHTEGIEVTQMNLNDLALYETMAQIRSDAPVEAIKAQALACLTTLYYQLQTGEPYQSTRLPFPTAYTQEYWKETLKDSYEQDFNIYKQAFEEIKNHRIICNGEPIMAISHALNTGVTESGRVLLSQDIPYLQEVASPADATAENQQQIIHVSAETVKQQLEKRLSVTLQGDPVSWISVSEKSQAGTVLRMQAAEQTTDGYTVQQLFSLPSAAFDVSVQDATFVFRVYGEGHFAGMSTYGAIAMAKDGQTYDQILKHYFSGVSIE